jgi:hypothetical protein
MKTFPVINFKSGEEGARSADCSSHTKQITGKFRERGERYGSGETRNIFGLRLTVLLVGGASRA